MITEFAESRKMECRLLSLNDSPELHRMSVGDREFVFTGCARAKGRFTATALRSARRHAKLVVAAHPYLAPVVQGMRIAAPRMKSIVVAHGIEIWEPLSTLRRRALRRSDDDSDADAGHSGPRRHAAANSARSYSRVAVGARSGF